MLKFLSEYFGLSNTEQKGLITLLILMILILVVPRIFASYMRSEEIPRDNTALLAQFYEGVDSSSISQSIENKTELTNNISYFTFDPNTASQEALISLGFKESTAATLINFRNKGGKFYKKEDLKKVYGVSEDLYSSLEAYIEISSSYNYTKYPEKKEEYLAKESTKETKKQVLVNINDADSLMLMTVNGIGKVYASRIIKYRKLLGGFHSIEQVKEVYGFSNEVYEGIKNQITVSGEIKQININTCTWFELKNHPYVGSDLANKIINFREKNGNFNLLEDLLTKELLSQESYAKLSPYLSLES